MRTLAARVKTTLDTHPLMSNACIYGGLYTLAEVSQQTMKANMTTKKVGLTTEHTSSLVTTRHSTTLDLGSVKRYAIMGTLVFPPILTKWYHWLEAKFPCTTPRVVMKKLVLDQFLLTPWVVVLFYVGMSALEGKRGQAMLDELRQKGLKTFFLDCCYWLPVQYLNFKFVPPWLRVSYIGVTTFIWLNILCYIKAMPSPQTKVVLMPQNKAMVEE